MAKTQKHKNLPNPEFSQAMHALRSSNAAVRHEDKRTKRARTRSAAKAHALSDWR